VDILSRHSLREKVLTYLFYQRQLHRSDSFSIPLNRQELADFLCVDRTSLSSELSRLRREGLLDFERSRFHLKLTEGEWQTLLSPDGG
jgi:CRP-like cAMP-binding protein